MTKMNRCYYFTGTEKHGQYIACLPDNPPVNPKIVGWEMAAYLAQTKEFPCELVLKPCKEKDKNSPVEWHDYMYNQFAFFIVSERLKKFLEKKSVMNDSIEWVNVNIRHEDIVKEYYIVMFTEQQDVIDEKNTKYYLEDNSILVPCISLEKAEKFKIFSVNDKNIPVMLYTTYEIKKELQKEKFSNLIFGKAKTSYNGVIVK